MANFLTQIGQLMKRPVFSGYGGRAGWGSRGGLPRNGFNYKQEAGPLYESSIPFMCLAWEKRNTVEAELVVQKRDENGAWKNVPAHPLYDLLSEPNPYWDMHELLDCVRFDYHLSGNAYLWKRRSGSGKVVELYWLPSWCTEPRWDESGLSQIDCFEYQVNGVSWAIPVKDVIHFKGVLPDPRSYGRKGLGAFSAVLREVCTDNEAAMFTASMLRNMGVPGVIISPKGTDGNPGEMTDDQRITFKKLWRENFTGENRGEPFVQSIPVDINMPGFSPSQMMVDKIRDIPETRIAGAFGIPLSVLQLSQGLENSNTNANKSDDREQAIESCVVPTLLGLARALSRGLIREIEDPREYRLWFDLSGMRCMQDNENELTKTLVAASGGPILTPNEARARIGKAPQPGGDVIRGAKGDAKKNKPDPGDGPGPGTGPADEDDADQVDKEEQRAKAKDELKSIIDANGAHHGEHDGRFVSKDGVSVPQFDNVDDAMDWADANLVQGAYLHDLPPELANGMNQTFANLDAKRGLLKNLVVGPHDAIAEALGTTAEPGHIMTTYALGDEAVAISYNEKMFSSQGEINRQLENTKKAGIYTIDSFPGLLTHEYAHVVHRNDPAGVAAHQEMTREIQYRISSGALTGEDVRQSFGSGVMNQTGDVAINEVFAESFRRVRDRTLDPRVEFLGDILKKHNLHED
jgi:HK97 family phage portal protein